VSETSVPVTISVLDKQYVVSCPPGEEESLQESARVLNERMSSMRESAKTLGSERLAVVTALNIVHEYLTMDAERRDVESQFQGDLERVQQKITTFLGRRSEAERVE